MSKAKTKVPITVLTGFLGSGKTTILNYILTHNEGRKIGVIVNDFGAINIDAKLVAKQTDTMMELSNGCICCATDSLELDEAIAQFVYEGSPIDYIVIEASGLAEPYDLMVSLRESLDTRVRLDSIVGVIDAHNIVANAKTNPTATKQAQYADFLVVNKIDLVDTTELAEIKQLLKLINPRAKIFETSHGVLELNLILDQEAWTKTADMKHDEDHSAHAHHQYSALDFSTDKPFEPAAFQNFVNRQMPEAVYRAKGIVDLGSKGHNRKYIFQLVGSRAEITWDNWSDEEPHTQLVFIGKEIDKKSLTALLMQCIDTRPDEYLPPSERVVLPKRSI